MLNSRQKEQLNAAIYLYLKDQQPEVAKHFQSAIGLLIPSSGSNKNVLASKWIATTRMQRKIVELNKEINLLKSKLSLFTAVHDFHHKKDGLPNEPAITTLKGHKKGITKLLFHPTFHLLISSSEDASIKIWNFDNNWSLEKSLTDHTDSVNDLDIDSSGKWLASASSDMTIKIWDLTSFSCIRSITGHDSIISAIAFKPNSEVILSCSKDHSIKLWNIKNGFCLRSFFGHSDWVRSIAIPPFAGNKIFATTGNDKRIFIWNFEDDLYISSIPAHNHFIETISFAPKIVLEHLYKYNLTSKPLPTNLRPINDESQNQDPFWDISGFLLVSASRDKEIKLWDIYSGQCLQTYIGHDNWVRGALFHPSGNYLISSSDDCSIKIWDLITGMCTRNINKSHNSFVLSLASCPHNDLIASGSMDSVIKIWQCDRAPEMAFD